MATPAHRKSIPAIWTAIVLIGAAVVFCLLRESVGPAPLHFSAIAAPLFAGLFLCLAAAVYAWLRQRTQSATLIQQLYEAVDQSGSAVMIVDLKGHIEYANTGLCLQTGFAREELAGRSWRELRGDRTSAKDLADIAAHLRAGSTWEGTVENRRKNGEQYPARANLSPVRRNDGKVSGFIGVFTDLSETHRKEQELRGAKEQAEAADQAKGRFLATMSHEVRTPLNGIVGFTNLLFETPLSPEQREYVQTIRTSGEALIQLTGDILDFSRIESGHLHLEAAPCDIRANIEDALDIFGGRAADNDVQLLHWIDPDIPSQVLIDGGRLRQVVINLVGNAVKFTSSGEIEVSVRMLTGKSVSVAPFEDMVRGQLVAELDDGGLTLEFSVRDTGIGISQADSAKLFQPFTQLDPSTVRRYGGAGLGLAISRHLVRMMGGDIRVESEPGHGSNFIFTIRTRPVGKPGATQPADGLPGLRIALLVRHAGLRSEVGHLLRLHGAKVLESEYDAFPSSGWDMAVVDCDEKILRKLSSYPLPAPWEAERIFGLVPVNLGAGERQKLRRHFRLLLNRPLHQQALIELMAKAADSISRRSASPLPLATQGLRVLVAEDEAVLQRLLASTLVALGCNGRFVGNGKDCLAAAKSDMHDIVVMDLHMPEMDGLTAVKQIRAGEAGEAMRDAWIIAVTADHRDEMRDMALVAGVDDFLAKPITLSDMDEALHRFLGARPAPKSDSSSKITS